MRKIALTVAGLSIAIARNGHKVKPQLRDDDYEFDPLGNLVRVEGGIKRVDLEPGKQSPLSIIPQRGVTKKTPDAGAGKGNR